jgi:hypothetical protein
MTKQIKPEKVDEEIEEIAQRILLELETASSTDLSNVGYAKKMLHLSDINYANRVLQKVKDTSGTESDIERRAVIKVLLFSTWLQRLYFIIRAYIMGLIASGVTFAFIWAVGSVNAITSYLFGIVTFAISLAVTRLFDKQLTQVTKKIVDLLANHRTIRDFIMKHF